MSHLWTKHIRIESPLKHLLVISTLTFSVLTPEFILLPLVSRFSIFWEAMSYAMSSLRVITVCKSCYPCHFWCHAFVQRLLSPKLVSMLTLSISLAYPKQCQYDLCPMSHQLILVGCSCWMMWDASMPSFQWSQPIDFSSLSGTDIRDLYSTLGPAVLSEMLFLIVDNGITLLSSDR